MNQPKRALSLILGLSLSLSLAACGGSSSTPAASGSDAASAAPAAPGENITLSAWHIWPDTTRGERESIDMMLADYAISHPNIKVQQDAADTTSYKTKLKVAFTGGDLPDVYFTYGAGFSKPFVETGRVLALDDKLPAGTLDRLNEGTAENYYYDGKLYGLPIKMWAGTMYANKELFEQEGLTPPTNWDELVAVCQAFRAKDIQPMCMGGKDAWQIAMYFDQIALREAGLEGIDAAMSGQKKFTDPEFLAAAEKLKQLVDIQAFSNGFAGLADQEAQAEFLMGRIPLYFNGSWLTGDIQSPENSVQDKIIAIPFPSVPGGKGEKNVYTGGAIDGWSVSAESKHIDEAVEFLVALCEHMSIQGYKAGDGISVWKNDVPESELNPVLAQITQNLSTAEGYRLAWDTQLSGADIDTYLQALQQLAGGGLTPQEFCETLQNNLTIAMK